MSHALEHRKEGCHRAPHSHTCAPHSGAWGAPFLQALRSQAPAGAVLSGLPGSGSAGLGISARPAPAPRLLSKILSECEDADEIEYLVDGSWCPIGAEKERSCSPQCPILVLGESRPRGPVLRPSLRSRARSFLSRTVSWHVEFPVVFFAAT